MQLIYTDEDIARLIREEKPYRDEQLTFMFSHLVERNANLQGEMDVRGRQGNNFQIKVRKGVLNPSDFSAILGVFPLNSTKLFILRRYNGLAHPHRDKRRKAWLNNGYECFHIHTASEWCQLHGFHEECDAVETDRYSTLQEALYCLIEDCGFVLATPPPQTLFGP